MPSFIDFDEVMPAETALAIIISVWLTKIAPDHLHDVALAPPILGRYTHGRLQRSSVSWPPVRSASRRDRFNVALSVRRAWSGVA
jgi:hypothetical protein